MISLSGAPWILLLVSALSHTLSVSVSETNKGNHQVRIVWSLSAAICAQQGAFERKKKTQPPLNVVGAYESQRKQLCSHITRTPCKSSDCKRFQCKSNQKKERVGAQTLSSSGKQTSPLKNPGTGPNIIVRMKSRQKCEALTIPCKNKTAGCYVPLSKRAVRVTSIVHSLKAYAIKAQAGVLNTLKSSSFKSALSIEPLWITNEIVVKGASVSDVQNLLKGNTDVKEVRPERLFRIPQVSKNPASSYGNYEQPVILDFWNTRAVDAHKVWSKGITGKGILVGHIDTGVSMEHEALKNNFRGEYGWFDPYHGKPDPYDDQGHGTHTMGTAVGQTKEIGAAPGATWMSCKGCRADGNCTESATKTCAQWILCPTKADGTDPDCSKAPLVVNNSWGDPILKDESDAPYQAEFDEIINCWRSAGIIPVFCNGNSGFNCKTTWYPAVSDKVISVGNVDQNDEENRTLLYAAYDGSSRGPPKPRFAQVIKPDVSAPGTSIDSASYLDPLKYVAMTGTSQAAPLVTGTIALLLQKYPSLQYDQVYAALTKSCVPVYIPWRRRLCGNISEKVWPNNHMGFGMINAYKVVFGSGTSEEDCQ